MSGTGYSPTPPPMPPYSIPEDSICRTCARLRFGIRYEFPHPRMWMDCIHAEPYAPIRAMSCRFYVREPGVD
ncbi:hypothetical protein [Cupriavidus metallidurans]